MHVIPSCEIPSFCTMDASSHTGNARLEPHIGNAGESVAGILTEKSRVTWHTYPGFVPVRTGHVSEPATSFVFEKLFSDRPPASDCAWRAAEFECEESAYPQYLTRGAIALLRPPARQPVLSRSFRIHLRSFMPAVQCSLFAPAQSLAGSL